MEGVSSNTLQNPPTTSNPPRPQRPVLPSQTVPSNRLSRHGIPRHLRGGQRAVPRRGPHPVPHPVPQGELPAARSAVQNLRTRRSVPPPRRPGIGANVLHRTGNPGPQAGVPPAADQRQGRQSRSRRPYHVNLESEAEFEVGLYSWRTRSTLGFRAVFSQQFPCSLVHSSVLDTLAVEQLELSPDMSERNIFCPLGRIAPRRYVGLAIHQPQLGFDGQAGHFLVLDDSVPHCGPDIYLGRPFLSVNFQGGLPQRR